MADLKITQLTAGTVKNTDLHVAVDTTDTSMAASGTDKKYLWSALKTDAAATFFTVTATQLLIAAGAGVVPTGDSGLTFASSILNAPTLLLKTALRIEDPGVGTNYVAFQSPTLSGNTTYTLPATDGSSGQALVTNGSGVLSFSTVSAGGNVTGPGSATDNALVRFDGATGTLIQNSLGILSDAGALSGLTQLDVDNIDINGNTISSTDTNGNIELLPNGTGVTHSTKALSSDTALILKQTTAGANNITLQSPSVLSSSLTFTLPPTDGTTGQAIVTDGTGVLSFVSISTPATVTQLIAFSGAWGASQSVTVTGSVDNDVVHLNIPAVSATGTVSAVVTSAALPLSLRPAVTQRCYFWALDNGAVVSGSAVISTGGVITISLVLAGIPHVTDGGVFTGSGATGWGANAITYSLLP